ncbi:MAG: hypothetical protein JWR22_2159, partial [Herminiimonas sp.]|nr:hypothetical protein [Herminiimonas sp.]
GMGVSLLPVDLFKGDLQSGSLVVLPVAPPISKVNYVAVYPGKIELCKASELVILSEIAQYA